MITQIDIINLSHYDLGFTDHPMVCRELQTRCLNQAIDLALGTEGFYWTVESNNAILDWWQKASAVRQKELVRLVRDRRIEVCAMPFNAGPTMDARQWRCCADWLPEKLKDAFRSTTIMQNDVNSFSRAGARTFLDRGVKYLWMGLNVDTGGAPLPQPSPFWWEIPDGRRLFVWLGDSYPNGYFLFEAEEWRRGPLPPAADTRYRPSRRGDFLVPSPENLRRAHTICCKKLAEWERQGYALSRVAVSMTNMWRVDNDMPCAMLPDFIDAWNDAGLTPRLVMTTPTPALSAICEEAGEGLPVMTGEWPSWWANGVASTPHELAASRQAKRLLDALDSPLYQSVPEIDSNQEQCTRQLCFFDEHTWGSWNSAAMPDSIDTRGQFAEKALFAHRALSMAELALGDANRRIVPESQGVHVVNPYPLPYTGWITLTSDCLRGSFAGVRDEISGEEQAFVASPGVSPFFTIPTSRDQFTCLDTGKVFPDNIAGKNQRFWVDTLPAHAVRSYSLQKRVTPKSAPQGSVWVLTTDTFGWPNSAAWADRKLFTEGLGEFSALEFQGLAPRWTYKEVFGQPTPAQRSTARDQHSIRTKAVCHGGVILTDTGPTLLYEQYLTHPRLRKMYRSLELCKNSPRAWLRITIDRLPKPESAEIFYIKLPLDVLAHAPCLTNGGMPFVPEEDQIPNSSRDNYAVDEQITYTDEHGGNTVLDCRDTALISLGELNDGLGMTQLGANTSTVYAILYNNIWYTNFAGDENGRMDFSFDLYYQDVRHSAFAPQAFAVVNA